MPPENIWCSSKKKQSLVNGYRPIPPHKLEIIKEIHEMERTTSPLRLREDLNIARWT